MFVDGSKYKTYSWKKLFLNSKVWKTADASLSGIHRLQGNAISYWVRRNRIVHLTKLFTCNGVSACALLWRFATVVSFMRVWSRKLVCIGTTDNNSMAGKWSLKQGLKTVLCILIIVLNAEWLSTIVYLWGIWAKTLIFLSFFKWKLRIFFSQWESCLNISWQPSFAVLLSSFLYLRMPIGTY